MFGWLGGQVMLCYGLNRQDTNQEYPLKNDEKPRPSDASYWHGTLLKCPGCRIKFPFSARDHSFEIRANPARAGSPDDEQPVPVTRCPQCQGQLAIT